MQSGQEFIDLFLGGIFCKSVLLLKFSNELLALAINHVKIVIRKLAPFFLYLAFVRFPLPLNLIPFHEVPPWKLSRVVSKLGFTFHADDIRPWHTFQRLG